MKLSRSNRGRVVVAVSGVLFAACVAALVIVFPAAAFASLEATPTWTSTTNPNPEGHLDPDSWRDGWGNSLYPEFSFTGIPADEGLPTFGFYYRVARLPIFPDDPFSTRTGISYDTNGTMIGHTLDLPGIFDELPVGERTSFDPSGINDPREGIWFMTVRFFNGAREATTADWRYFGIDVTPPRPVKKFTTGVSLPTESRRRTVTWVNENYDDLSGSHFFELYLNGQRVRNITLTGFVPAKVTLEDLPPGENKLAMRTVDRATNVSTFVYHTDIVDPDVPSAVIASPKNWAWVSGTKTFSVISTDLACDPTVTLKIDGVVKATDSKPPYELSVDTKKLSPGKHTFSATAKDLFGHSRTDTRYFQVDNTPISISSISASPNPFYPVLKDGYKDTTTMKAYLNEGAVDVYLEIFNEGGSQVREYHRTNVSAGTVSMGWDGKDSAGNVSMGTFWYRFVAKDRAGNYTTSGLSSIPIRDYEVVRIGPGKVRVVPR